MECRFCNINPNKTKILKEGNFVRVIFSNPRLMPGHLLIIPKRHVHKISELNDKEKEELFKTTIHFQEEILNKIASGCDIRQNCRPFQKQDKLKVDHLHIHLQPRELFDELYEKCQIFEKDVFSDLSEEEVEKITSLLDLK
jgi:diadenosine tetraphosphate (Ap4A) HIT family hydrolase